MKRQGYMFTNKSHPQKGIVSTILGGLDLICLFLVILLCFEQKGEASARFAVVAMFSFLFSCIGLVLGVMSRVEKDRYYLFPNIGIIANFMVLAFTIFMLILGVS